MGLTEYRQKRDFRVTREPRGGSIKQRRQQTFVVQKHAASHLHYDLRLELDGVLKSWAVPKGPSLDPAHKRLAMQVEDHPLEYSDFEGLVPEGEYGAGAMLLWDQGTWEPVDDGRNGYEEGALKFILHGQKLRGKWMLVRRGGKRADKSERHWFLFKERDEFAQPGSDITADAPLSVTSGRSLDEVATETAGDRPRRPRKGDVRPRVSRPSSRPPKSSSRKPTQGSARSNNVLRRKIAKALEAVDGKAAAFPKQAKVKLATSAEKPPENDDWIHEIKFDGYRMLCFHEGEKVRFISRNGQNWTANLLGLAQNVAELPIDSAILDGEVVVLEPDGRTSFAALQNAFQSHTSQILFYAFDLLYLNSLDIRHAAIEDRKAVLRAVIPTDAKSPLRYSDHMVGNGATFFAEAARLQLEGIVSKKLGRPYTPGRTPDWLKIKCLLREEFVIGGFTKPSGGRKHFGAIAVGYYDRSGDLIYAGRVGTGFSDQALAALQAAFSPLMQKDSPFKAVPAGQAKGVTWLKPQMVAQVEFSNWTPDGQLRHPSFQGLREDKPAKSIVRNPTASRQTSNSIEKGGESTDPEDAAFSRPPSRTRRNSGVTDEPIALGIKLSHPEKVLYPEDGISKLDLAHYYAAVAPWMLPHVENRLLSLVRCPQGSGQKCFFQKHPGVGTPDALRRWDVKKKNEVKQYLTLHNAAGLLSLVQMGVLEIHTWGSQADRYEKPDRLIFDLDPDPSVEWQAVVIAAREVRLLLEELDLISFVKTTGGKGLHVVVPIQRRTTWDDAKTFCQSIAAFMVAAAPDRYIAKMSKAARKGKIFVDYFRNEMGATTVAPYSTRNRTGAPVSVPISWEELTDRIKSDQFNVRNLTARMTQLRSDPWAAIHQTKQSITASMRKKLKWR
jgi:bifunctional non-homologous end joining protein LigD